MYLLYLHWYTHCMYVCTSYWLQTSTDRRKKGCYWAHQMTSSEASKGPKAIVGLWRHEDCCVQLSFQTLLAFYVFFEFLNNHHGFLCAQKPHCWSINWGWDVLLDLGSTLSWSNPERLMAMGPAACTMRIPQQRQQSQKQVRQQQRTSNQRW